MIKLDANQKKAIYASPNESILVIAPPGAGKTFTMAKRIGFLININAVKKPHKILGLTFSNAAADEMKNRLRIKLNSSKGLVHITNFHSFAYSVLKAYGNHIDLNRNFLVIGEIDSEEIIKEKLGISKFFALGKYDPRRKIAESKLNKYKKWKNERILKQNDKYEDSSLNTEFENALKSFRDELKIQNFLDFDHILYYAYELLKNNESILNYYKSTFKHILVDEFQDTNPLQFKLLEVLVNGNNSKSFKAPVFILADPNQGIYEFQGADPKNVYGALKSFNCELIKLDKEYRFESIGIKLLKEAISTFIDEKKLILIPASAEKPIYSCLPDKENEAEWVLEKIEGFKKDKVKLHEIAVLSPMGSNFEIIKNMLNKEEYIFIPDFKGTEIEKKYASLFEDLKNVSKSEGSVEKIILEICKNNGISIEDDVIAILIKISRKHDKNISENLSQRIILFLNEILLEINWAELLRKQIKNKIFLSTIHSAKGLEFERVIVCGLEKGALPFFPICNECKGTYLDEKEWIKSLKLFNVAISRSKEQLYILSSYKNINGYRCHPSCIVKPFYHYLEID